MYGATVLMRIDIHLNLSILYEILPFQGQESGGPYVGHMNLAIWVSVMKYLLGVPSDPATKLFQDRMILFV